MEIAICHHISLSYPGGGEKLVMSLAKHLHTSGHKVSIYSLPYKRRRTQPPEIPKGVLYDEQVPKRVEADVAYVVYAPLMWIPYKLQCPAIAGFHSDVFFTQRLNPRYGPIPLLARVTFDLIGRYDLKKYAAVRFPLALGRLPHVKTYVVPDFVDGRVFRPNARKLDRFTVAYAGRPYWQKGWDVFREVATRMAAERDVDFVAFGPMESTRDVRSAGYITDQQALAETYSRAHLIFAPSRVDTFGLSLVESLMCGTPVLTTPIEAHLGLKLPFFYGSTPQDFVDAITKVRSLWNDRGSYADVQSKCREAAGAYDSAMVIPSWLDMFQRVSRDSLH